MNTRGGRHPGYYVGNLYNHEDSKDLTKEEEGNLGIILVTFPITKVVRNERDRRRAAWIVFGQPFEHRR